MEPVTAILLLGGLNAGMGLMKSEQARKQREQEMRMRAAEIEASPWTGRAPSTQVSTPSLNPWAEMAGGAINAAGQAAALQSAGLLGSASGATEGAASAASTAGGSSGQNASFLNPWEGRPNASFMNPWERMTGK